MIKQEKRACRVFVELMTHMINSGQVPAPSEDPVVYGEFSNKLLRTIEIIDQRHTVTVKPHQIKKRIRERMPEYRWPEPPAPRKPKWMKEG